MSTDLVDYLYFEAKEKAFEMEIEARKEFETKRNNIIKEKKTFIDEQFEREDKQKSTDFKQFFNKKSLPRCQPKTTKPTFRTQQGSHQTPQQNTNRPH